MSQVNGLGQKAVAVVNVGGGQTGGPLDAGNLVEIGESQRGGCRQKTPSLV